MELSVPNSGIDSAETLRVVQENGGRTSDGHIGLIRVEPVLLVHPRDLGDLFLQVFPVSVALQFCEGAGGGKFDLYGDKIVLKPLLSLKAAPVYRILVSFFEDVIDALKPGIREISGLNVLE
jgi:hypothetical protein